MVLNSQKFKNANIKSLKSLGEAFPVIISVLLLISLLSLIPQSLYGRLFGASVFSDLLIGSFLGSVLAGNPLTSYILGNGFLENGVSLMAVTAFIVTWTTVGVVQLPAEIVMLGKRFAISRNIVSLLFSLLVAFATVQIVNIF